LIFLSLRKEHGLKIFDNMVLRGREEKNEYGGSGLLRSCIILSSHQLILQ
jgi:hypothetical protein